jgi:hypothetical protein
VTVCFTSFELGGSNHILHDAFDITWWYLTSSNIRLVNGNCQAVIAVESLAGILFVHLPCQLTFLVQHIGGKINCHHTPGLDYVKVASLFSVQSCLYGSQNIHKKFNIVSQRRDTRQQAT